MASDKLLNCCLENPEGIVLVESWGRKGFSITHTMHCNGTYYELVWSVVKILDLYLDLLYTNGEINLYKKKLKKLIETERVLIFVMQKIMRSNGRL